jgi:glycosyltransferase involved in cell wall biosynthesis
MTHDPLFTAGLVTDTRLLRTAIIYDFIPHRRRDFYLPGVAQRLEYAVALHWLGHYDLFAPISQATADDLSALFCVPAKTIVVTGCPVDTLFESNPDEFGSNELRHILVVGGGDPRKNPEVAVRAHAGSAIMQRGAGIPLVLAGNYSSIDAEAFRAVAAASGGRRNLIEVPGQIDDLGLLGLYRRAFAIVCASRDEGFSLPIIEGMAARSAVLASDIPVHAELVADADRRFPVDDDGTLCSLLERAVTDSAWRSTVLAQQSRVWPRFRAVEVAKRFWTAIAARISAAPASPAVIQGRKSRIAVLSPIPPDRSGVADYTAATCGELGRLAEVHVFTETKQPLPLSSIASVKPLTVLPYFERRFDRVVNVIGNSHFHVRIFDLLRRYGGACIAHDARMLGFYTILLGRERALATASRELGRTVTDAELNEWMSHEGKLEALFLGDIAESAAPTIVHSPVTKRLFLDRYGVDPVFLPFSIYRPWTAAELSSSHRQAARARLAIPTGEIAIATFGFVQTSKAPIECVWALEMLRSWGVHASLHFVGKFEDRSAPELRTLIEKLDLSKRVRFARDFVAEQVYRDYLLAADLAIQLRTYGLGGLSGAVLDCAAAGLPTVTNAALAAAVGVPTHYFRSIPDALSPVLLAEALYDLLESGLAAQRPESERQAFSEEHSIAVYARGLCRALELDVPAAI